MNTRIAFPRWLTIPLSATLAFYLAEFVRGYAPFAHDGIAGEALAPYQYRVLFAQLFVPVANAIGDYPAAWVALPYLAAIAVFGVWREFRLFIPLLPLALPLAMRGPHDD